jgi:hypothetical protein
MAVHAVDELVETDERSSAPRRRVLLFEFNRRAWPLVDAEPQLLASSDAPDRATRSAPDEA